VFRAIASFESKFHLRAPLFYILLLVYALLTFAAVTTEGVTIGGALGNVNRNSPFVIMQLLMYMSIFGILTTTAFVANSIHRPSSARRALLQFPIKKYQSSPDASPALSLSPCWCTSALPEPSCSAA
jgi:hypothetical protein